MSAEQLAPLISVVIPTFNYAATLERAVASAMAQGGEDFDLWIVDDGSCDGTPQVAAALEQRWPGRCRYRRQDNAGPAAARNQGLQLSQGRYLLFFDADDELLPDALATFRAAIREHPEAGVILAEHESVEEGGKTKRHRQKHLPDAPLERLRAYLLEKTVTVCHGAVLLRRDVFAAYRYPVRFRAAEDLPVFAHALANFPCTLVRHPTARIHKHAGSLRGNSDAAAAGSLDLVEEIFDAQRMPAWAMGLKPAYTARRHLSLFRTLLRAGRHGEALQHYLAALRQAPGMALRPGYIVKALRAVGPAFL